MSKTGIRKPIGKSTSEIYQRECLKELHETALQKYQSLRKKWLH